MRSQEHEPVFPGGGRRPSLDGSDFWEPGGDIVHLRAANNLTDGWTRFVVVMVCRPGQPMLALVAAQEDLGGSDRA